MPEILKQTLNLGGIAIKKLRLKAKCGYDDWYGWRVAKWGTKWLARGLGGNYDKPEFDRQDDECLIVRMSTAWCLPEGIIKKIMRDYPDIRLRIDCMEDCLNFAGTYECANGELSQNLYEPSEKDCDKWFQFHMPPATTA